MSKRFTALGQYVYERGNRIGFSPDDAAEQCARRLNGYEQRIKRYEDEVKRLKSEVERLTKAGDAMACIIKYHPDVNTFDPVPDVVKRWNAAKEGKDQP